jgi:RNA polymerase sigma factor (sigma-70 family)
MSEFESLLAGCRRRESVAFAALVERYLPHVRAAVRRRLNPRLRARFDSADFTQNVWASFFQMSLDRLDLTTEAALVAYLARMAEVKVFEEVRHQLTRKADVRRDVPLGEVPEPSGRVPTPSGEVAAADRWAELTAGLSTRDQDMLGMLRDGHTHQAVAARFGLTAKTVQRLMDKLRGRGPTGDLP